MAPPAAPVVLARSIIIRTWYGTVCVLLYFGTNGCNCDMTYITSLQVLSRHSFAQIRDQYTSHGKWKPLCAQNHFLWSGSIRDAMMYEYYYNCSAHTYSGDLYSALGCRIWLAGQDWQDHVAHWPLFGEGSRYVTVWRRKQKHGTPSLQRGAWACGALWRGGHEPPSVRIGFHIMWTHMHTTHTYTCTHTWQRLRKVFYREKN